MGRQRVRALVGVALVALSLGAVTACGSDDDDSGSTAAAGSTTSAATGGATTAASKGTVDIAYIDVTTGQLAFLSSGDQAQAAIDSVNAAGGVNGYKINMKRYDMGQSPQEGVAAVRQAINDKPLAVLWANGASIDSGLKLLAKSGIPGLAYSGTPASLSSDTFFPWAGKSYGASSTAWGSHCVKDVGRKKIAIPGATTPGVEGVADLWADLVKSIGGQVVYKRVGIDATSNPAVTQTAKQIKDSGAQCVMSILVPGSPQLQVALNQLGADVFVGEPAAYGPEIEKQFGSSADGLMFISYFASLQDTDNPGVQRYLADMKQYSPNADPYCLCVTGYATAKFFIDVLSRVTGEPTQAKILKAANQTRGYDADGLVSPINFPENHTQPTRCLGYSQMKDGKWTAVKGNGKNGMVCGEPFPPPSS